tara:strand:+ start:4617 stop:5204 length:588 start_codon:yes stop_codon:yes gene_type:complete
MKRFFDIILSIIFLILFLPIMIFISIIIYFNMGSPIIFKQERPGLDEDPFIFYKFRTMTDVKEKKGYMDSDYERITKLGKFLRYTSLDELPSFWNVLIGNMSIVGPRPLLTSYLSLYSNEQKRRHNVKPGITGLAQVSGRNQISWDKKFELDLWYVDHHSFYLDFKIILQTIIKVLKVEGIDSSRNETMEKFRGE